MNRTHAVALTLAISALLAAAPAAGAKTYCVGPATCPAGGTARPSLEDAVNGSGGADSNPDADTIVLGPGTYTGPAVYADEQVEIVGAGMGQTTLLANTGSSTFLWLKKADSSVRDLSLRLTYDDVVGLRLDGGSDATRVQATSSGDDLDNVNGFLAEDSGSTLTGLRTDLSPIPNGTAVSFHAPGLLTDSTIVGGVGVSPAGSLIRRSTIQASTGVNVSGSTGSSARDVVITPHPRDTGGAFLFGLAVTSGSGGQDASMTASHMTLVGPGPDDGIGLRVRSSKSSSQGTAGLKVTNSVIHGFETSYERDGRPAPQAANLSLSYSAFDESTAEDSGNGVTSAGVSNIKTPIDPKFVDAAGLDFRPRFDSPLIDEGDPAVLVSDPNGDRAERARVRDGNGNGSETRDIGAYEYQHLAPVAAFGFSPTQPLIGTAVAFTSTVTDPDGDPVAYSWAFGDGATASTPDPSHSYGSAGVREARLTATDATGLAGTATRSVSVAGPTGSTGTSSVADRTKPTLSGLSLSRASFKRTSRLSFRLSEAARVSFTIERKRSGRRSGGRCVAKTKANARRKACTRWVRMRGSIAADGKGGSNSLTLRARLAGQALAPGSYRLTGVATDPARNASRPARRTFRITR